MAPFQFSITSLTTQLGEPKWKFIKIKSIIFIYLYIDIYITHTDIIYVPSLQILTSIDTNS